MWKENDFRLILTHHTHYHDGHMVQDQVNPLAGPSRHQNAKKSKSTPLRSNKAKKLTEKRKIEALEREAMDFVSQAPILNFQKAAKPT